MREILFRGKRLDNGEWVEGFYFQIADNSYILTIPDEEQFFRIKVFPLTVGQFTGLCGKNGKKIFEGDVVKMHYFFDNYDPMTFGVFEDESEIVCNLSIDSLGVRFENQNMSGYLCDFLQDPTAELEVIGTIYDKAVNI